MKDFNQITGKLIGLPTQLIISDKFVSFLANTKTLENGKVIKAPIVLDILAIEGFTVTEKKVGKATKRYEFIDSKSQETICQMVKYTVK